MVTKSFVIKKRDFQRKPYTVLQHKIRRLMRCYTIRDLEFDEINFTFTFKKSHLVNGVKMEDPKEYSGYYELEDTDNLSNVILKLMI